MYDIWDLGEVVQRHLLLCAGLAIVAGLAAGNLCQAPAIKMTIPFILFLMLYPAFLDINFSEVKKSLRSPRLLLAALLINFVLCPLVISSLVKLFLGRSHPSLIAGMFFFGLIPCGGMVPAYTDLLKGNINLSLAITAISLLITIGIVPLWMKVLLGKMVLVPMPLIIRYLAVIIMIPLCFAVFTRQLLIQKKGPEAFLFIKKRLQVMTGLALILMMFVICFLNAERICHEPQVIPKILLPASLFLIILLAVSSLIARGLRSSHADSTALVISTTVKNNAISIALALSTFGHEAALAIAITGPLAQAPIMLTYINLIRRRGEDNPARRN
jgi:ACR3 family arsenite transporter